MPAPNEQPIQDEHRKVMNEIAKIIDGAINKHGEKKYGFALMVFDFGSGGFMNYICNASRPTMMQATQEFLDRNRTNTN